MTRDGGRAELVLAAVLASLVALWPPSTARAGDIEEFQAAYALYEAHDWQGAIAQFEGLVGGETPTLQSQPLVLESRKYLAAAYVFMGREEAAAEQFERLLHDEPTYELDATEFPREVVQLFERVRTRLAERRAMEAAQAALEAEVERLRAENTAMRAELSGDRTVEVPRSQWLMFIPFGVGQFENGEDGTGLFFAITEALAAVGLFVTLATEQWFVAQLRDLRMLSEDDPEVLQVNFALQVLGPLNWSLGGALGVLGIAGVVQANLAFTPTRTVRVPGATPPAEASPAVSLRVTPGFVGLTGTF